MNSATRYKTLPFCHRNLPSDLVQQYNNNAFVIVYLIFNKETNVISDQISIVNIVQLGISAIDIQ